MNTPAVTMVAAWIKALTGVGPSIASGSQVWSGNCADLPIAPTNSSRHSSVIVSTCRPAKPMVEPASAGAAWRIAGIETVPNTRNVPKMPSEKPKSPMRLTMNALSAAALAARVDPVEHRHDRGLRVAADILEEHGPAEQRADEQSARGHDLGAGLADPSPAEAGDNRREQRQEDNELQLHQPRIRLTSS